MDWQQVHQVIELLGKYGTPLVITGVVIVFVVGFAWWLKGHVDRKIAKDEERRDRQEQRHDKQTEMFGRSTEAMEQMAEGIKPIAQAVDRMDRRIEEHGHKIDRMHRHIFKEEGERGD